MELRTYDEAEAFLNGFVNYEKLLGNSVRYDTSEFDRDTFRRLLCRLGDPHLRYAVIHVAGTKGKGSTCAFLESVLRAAGLKTGLYTSPHICRYTERIQVGGEPIADSRFCELLSRLSALRESAPGSTGQPGFRTVFELLTASALLHFAEEQVQVAIVETGLGGRLDSTNVFDQPGAGPLINVLTPMAFDHTAVLGDTIEKITSEKAGILRPHGITVLAPQPREWGGKVRNVVETRLHQLGMNDYMDAGQLVHWRQIPPHAYDEVLREIGQGSPRPHPSAETRENLYPGAAASSSGSVLPPALFTFDEHAWRSIARTSPGSLAAELLHSQPLLLRPSLPGAHQLDNLRTVLCALTALDQAGTVRATGHLGSGYMGETTGSRFHVSLEAVRLGVSSTRWPGRFEILSRDPLVIVDGAHCPLSARSLADTFTALYGPEREVILVAGFLRDKAAEEICAALQGRLRVAEAITCTPPTPRARPAEETAEALASTLSARAMPIPDPAAAIREALLRRQGDQAVLIFGSMYLIGPAGETLSSS